MKRPIAPAIALAAAVALGTTGCGFFVLYVTMQSYAPSDGVETNLPSVDVRNLMIIAGEDSANIVFTGVNRSDETTRMSIKLVDQGSQIAQRNFTVEPGVNVFGVDEAEIVPVPGLLPGSVVTGFLENDGTEVEKSIPVLDGTLSEYAELVP